MNNAVIRVENLGKLYRIGEIGTGTISHDLNRFWAKLRGKEDPYSKVGILNDRTQRAQKGEHVWALQDVDFEVRHGEVLGVIGKNGAGKSTLLKLLSRVTSPTQGQVKIKGRVASLLEVGTGFHPEMTGRENIYMNGTIMGMRRHEIAAKLDDIVDFAGIAKYLDTPVKRYSSGMTVRLGFAIAAFLEPEILIVDEVLAVGDAEFQKRAIGKMQDVSSGEGRTVLFVSHNMSAIKQLCDRTILLEKGRLLALDKTSNLIDQYLGNQSANSLNNKVNGLNLKGFTLDHTRQYFSTGDDLCLGGSIEGKCIDEVPYLIVSFTSTVFHDRILLLSSRLEGVSIGLFKNKFDFSINIFSLNLMPGQYDISLKLSNLQGTVIANWGKVGHFEVYPDEKLGKLSLPDPRHRGVLYCRSAWEVKSS